jgi:hypothetical protein
MILEVLPDITFSIDCHDGQMGSGLRHHKLIAAAVEYSEVKDLLRAKPVIKVVLLIVLTTVIIGSAQADSELSGLQLLQRQLKLLEGAFAPRSFREASDKWAEGVKTRNGAAQFAVLSPELRSRLRNQYEELMWVTGTSSPWVSECAVRSERKISETQMEFDLLFKLTTSAGPAGEYIVTLAVGKDQDRYFITRIISEVQGLFPY